MSEERYDDEDYEEEDVENSAEDEYEDDASASDDEDAIDGTEEAAEGGEMEHVEWGFEPKKRRFSKEVVLGLLAVTGLIGVFAFVVHNQFSGGGEEVASTDDPSGAVPGSAGAAPGSELGTEGTTEDDDPFAEKPDAGTDPFAADGPGTSIASLNSGEPPLASDLSDPLSGQSEPDFGTPAGPAGTTDPFTADSFEPAGTPDSSAADFNVASRDSVFGGPTGRGATGRGATGGGFTSQPADVPFASQPATTGALPEVDPLLSALDSPGTSTGQPASMLPDENLLGSTPAAGAGAASLDPLAGDPLGAEPFGSKPVGTAGTLPLDEKPRGLFETEPAGSSLAGGQGKPFQPGLPENTEFGQQGRTGRAQPAPLGTSGGAGSLPLVADDGGLAPQDSFGQPAVGLSDPQLDLPQPGSGGLLSETKSSPAMLGNDALVSEPEFDSPAGDSFGSQPADGFQEPVVAKQKDPFGSNRRTSPATLGTPSGLEASTGAATTIRSDLTSGAMNPSGSTYTVAENDSFWSISRKVYGSPKYFEALQEYNRAKVDDPKKLRPGMVLDTPSPSVLADYLDGGAAAASPQAIADGSLSRSGLPTAASSLPTTVGSSRPGSNPAGLSGGILPVEPTGASETVQTVASAPSNTAVGDSQQSGFFIGNQGYPMYRVANGDTLTAIAADHLGRASRWKQIYRMNEAALKSPNELAPGLVLKLPGDASRVPLIDRTGSLR